MILAILAGGCGIKDKPSDKEEKPAVQLSIPAFNADSAWHYVDKQVSFGPRVPGTPAHAQCVRWMVDKLEQFADTVIVQDFRTKIYNGKVMNGKNIIASFNPESHNRVLLCAHYDSRPFADHDPDPANHRLPVPAANDGGSGVGILIEIARQLQIQPITNKGIDIVLFDLEDWGEPSFEEFGADDSWALGAQHWSKNPHIPGYRAMYGILYDMAGAENAVFTMEGTSMYYAPDIMRRVWDEAHNSGYGLYFSFRETGALTDDHLYINQITGIPTIDIIHYDPNTASGFFPYWHTVNDDMEHISRETLKAAGQVGLNYIFKN